MGNDDRKTRWLEHEQLENGMHEITYTTQGGGAVSAVGTSVSLALRNLADEVERREHQ